MALLRSLHFVPGISPKMMEKAYNLNPDILLLDLEDSVPLQEKERARELVSKEVAPLAQAGKRVFVRINSFASGLAEKDLEAVIGPHVSGINLPKPESSQEVLYISSLMEMLERRREIATGKTRLIAWIETAKAVYRALEIASCTPRMIGVAFGAEDFALDMGIPRSAEGTEVFVPRAQVAIAARVANVLAFDTPYTDFRNEAGLIEECRLVRRLGYHGKFTIHPSQISPVNQVFAPAPEEIEEARRIVEAFEEGQRRGTAAISLDGRMVDTPVYERARRLLYSLEPASDETL